MCNITNIEVYESPTNGTTKMNFTVRTGSDTTKEKLTEVLGDFEETDVAMADEMDWEETEEICKFQMASCLLQQNSKTELNVWEIQ